jgi:alkaline phosphatase D
VRRGSSDTSAASDYTVKIDVDRLTPMTRYHYRFRCNGQTSPVGITQTLPTGMVKDVVLAIASCSHYACGFFNAYREIALLDRVDIVLHLGDYIYEYGGAPDQLGMATGEKIGRVPLPLNEAVTLADYRGRYACHRLDTDLQAAHARAPWICEWDDHETANDDWMGGAQNHQPSEGDWFERRSASVRAFYDWMPIRDPEPGKAYEAINRTFELGNLATLIMLENRFLGRTKQLSLGNPQEVTWNVFDLSNPQLPVVMQDSALTREMLAASFAGKPVPSPYAVRVDPDSIRRSLKDPARTIYGAEQEKWLADEMSASVKAGKAWQLLGNEVVMARTTGVDIPGYLGSERWQRAMAQADPGLRAWLAQMEHLPADIPFSYDAWDGYPAARERVNTILAQAGAHPIVMSGDSHAFWMNQLSGAGRDNIAAEIGTTSITTSSLSDMLGVDDLGPAYPKACKEVLYCNQAVKGFALLTLNAEEAKVDLIGVSTVFSKTYTRFTLKSYRIRPNAGGGIASISET